MVTKTTVNIETSQHMKPAPVLCLTLLIPCFILSTQLHAWWDARTESTRESQKLTRHRQKDLNRHSLAVPLLPLKCDISLDTAGMFNPKAGEGISLRVSHHRTKLRKVIQCWISRKMYRTLLQQLCVSLVDETRMTVKSPSSSPKSRRAESPFGIWWSKGELDGRD